MNDGVEDTGRDCDDETVHDSVNDVRHDSVDDTDDDCGLDDVTAAATALLWSEPGGHEIVLPLLLILFPLLLLLSMSHCNLLVPATENVQSCKPHDRLHIGNSSFASASAPVSYP